MPQLVHNVLLLNPHLLLRQRADSCHGLLGETALTPENHIPTWIVVVVVVKSFYETGGIVISAELNKSTYAWPAEMVIRLKPLRLCALTRGRH
jgi:hypothetical protein